MQHSLGKLNMLHYFPEKLFSGYDIQRWKPDPALMFHAAKAMNVNVENCILVDDSSCRCAIRDRCRNGSVLLLR